VAVNSHGGIVAVRLYWPYGDNEYSWGTMPTTYNFTGQRLDSVTGLHYFNFRYYDPVSGRFTRADTVQTNAQGMDPYAYVGDSPIGKTDPSGHSGSWWQTALVVAAVVAVVAVVVVVAVVAAPVVLVAAATAAEVAGTAVAADGAVVAGAVATSAVVASAEETTAANVAETAGVTAETAVTSAETTSTATETTATNVGESTSGLTSEEGNNSTTTYSRVQGGNPPKASQYRIFVNDDGSIRIPNKSANLCISLGCDHAEYFQGLRGQGSEIVQFDLPSWLHDFINESYIKQFGYTTNPLNQGGTIPKLVDETTPGDSFEFPPPWIRWIEEYGMNGHVFQ
jgi:RHS repeat-associated protein